MTHIESWENNQLLLAAPLSSQISTTILRNLPINVRFITESALYTAQVNFLKSTEQKGIHYYQCQLLIPLVREQHRQSFRVNLLLDVDYQFLVPDYSTPYPMQCHHGQITNISIGGISMLCSQKLTPNTLLNLHFNLLETDFNFIGEVICVDPPDYKGLFPHHIQFMNLTTTEENTLSRLIIEKQRLIRRVISSD